MRPAIPLAIILSACTPEARSAAEVEVCRAVVRADFHRDAESCETEQCIDALTERELVQLKECR